MPAVVGGILAAVGLADDDVDGAVDDDAAAAAADDDVADVLRVDRDHNDRLDRLEDDADLAQWRGGTQLGHQSPQWQSTVIGKKKKREGLMSSSSSTSIDLPTYLPADEHPFVDVLQRLDSDDDDVGHSLFLLLRPLAAYYSNLVSVQWCPRMVEPFHLEP